MIIQRSIEKYKYSFFVNVTSLENSTPYLNNVTTRLISELMIFLFLKIKAANLLNTSRIKGLRDADLGK